MRQIANQDASPWFPFRGQTRCGNVKLAVYSPGGEYSGGGSYGGSYNYYDGNMCVTIDGEGFFNTTANFSNGSCTGRHYLNAKTDCDAGGSGIVGGPKLIGYDSWTGAKATDWAIQ